MNNEDFFKNFDYNEYLDSLDKEDLIEIVKGNEESMPVNKSEPRFHRTQILWGLNRLAKRENNYNLSSFESLDELTEDLISELAGYKWDNFYRYDFLRFDFKKPNTYKFLLIFGFILMLAGLGLIELFVILFNLFVWS